MSSSSRECGEVRVVSSSVRVGEFELRDQVRVLGGRGELEGQTCNLNWNYRKGRCDECK